MDKTTRNFALLFAALFVLGCGAFLLLRNTGGAGRVAKIYSDGALVHTVDLDAVTVPYTLEVSYGEGHNTVYIEKGRISVSEADCPDQLCVHQGSIENGAIPIVCLPHRLVIQVEGEP